ncbi:uncharacterized protein LOC124826291 [Vigna umbellata]|uniref:uncharacterized protein LOC124826291 n=1 Tax=Vigna umbellata TaxID=87088 RepID=UPI001F5EB727|nr:uncharacterized protein LOC124826291 [Vigna umbellata]
MSLNLQLKYVEKFSFKFLQNALSVNAFTFPFHLHTHSFLSFPSLPRTHTHPRFRPRTTVFSAVTAEKSSAPPVRMVAVAGHGAASPLKPASWEEVMLHTAKRLKWVDEGYELLVFTDECIVSGGEMSTRLQKELRDADILVIIAVTKQESVEWINNNSKTIENVICLDSSSDLKNRLGGYDVPSGVRGNIFGTSQSDKAKESYEVVQTVSEAWDRHNSDDIRFCLLVIINAYIRPVPVLNNLRAKGFSTLNCMLRNCGRQVLNCLLDPNCRKALQCMNQCSPVDQVCNYRCIASNESANLESFSQCVLQKNNCLGLEAEIPEKPCVPPMVKFRGQNLSYEMAEDLFVGWLGSLQWSWRVVAGQNPAYDQFPCQYQLFYRGKEKGSFWCEPVFQVKTLEGQMVWRRRKYRVRRGKVPGTFYFSVLDNGVASNEFWTIVDVAENLSWGLFHYHGAARVAGQSYTGAVLVSPDGAFPTDNRERTNIVAALDKCEIKEWELYNVDNCSCIDPPLGIPEGSSLHTVVQIEDPKQLSV